MSDVAMALVLLALLWCGLLLVVIRLWLWHGQTRRDLFWIARDLQGRIGRLEDNHDR